MAINRVLLSLLALALAASLARAQQSSIALVGARILPVSGRPVARGVVLIESGKIKVVGPNLAVPAGAQVVDLTGRVLIPGLVDAHSSLFLSDAELAGAGAADRDVLDAVDFFDRDAEQVLAHGVTTVYLSPGNRSGINGVGAVVKLGAPGPGDAEGSPRAQVLRPRAALKLALGLAAANRSSSLDRLASYESLRTAFRSAQQYAKSFERDEQQPNANESRPRRVPAQEVLAAALKGEIPVRIEAHRADDILNALRLADEFRFKLVLERATEGARLAREIAARQVPVVWGPVLLPGPPRLDTLNHSPAGAAALARAGVRVALVTAGQSGLTSRFLLENAAAASGFGMKPEDALRAVTLTAAEVLGVADRLGSIEPGKDADLVVLSALPWSPTAKVEQVFVNGAPVYPR
jgi:imidazolonepropionase-like amidohydrolase